MQITDMLNQYNRNIASGTEISSGTQGVKQIVSSLQEMSVGNVFEGSVTHMENGSVTLGLPDGKSIQARLDAGVSVREGESMFFQVRSNNGAQIAIRPFSHEAGANPALLNALKAANLPVSGKTITMVNTMMEQSMSIDKQSLAHMARLMAGSKGMDVATMVQMEKLGIPITEEMAAQFENYKSDQYAILDQLEAVMELLPEKLAGGGMSRDDLLSLNQQMARIFLGINEAAADGKVLINPGEAADAGMPGQSLLEEAIQGGQAADSSQAAADGPDASILSEGGLKSDASVPPSAGSAGGAAADVLLQAAGGEEKAAQDEGALQQAKAGTGEESLLDEAAGASAKFRPDLLRNSMDGGDLQQLARQLAKVPELLKDPKIFSDGEFSGNLTAKDLLASLEQAFSSKNPFSRHALAELASSKAYRSLVRNVMERQWLLRPEEIKKERGVSELYERMDRQMEQMEKALQSFGQSSRAFSDTAAGVRHNIQFMHQLNQTYAYVQIPLKFAGQNAHSDLYVYTDKRKAREKDGELTAFLHLDLDHLGSTDVSVKLCQKKVSTNFYLADDASYDLILKHMDLLIRRLEEKGYQAKVNVTNQEEKVNFVEDMLKQGASSPTGMVHRYSFDVRA